MLTIFTGIPDASSLNSKIKVDLKQGTNLVNTASLASKHDNIPLTYFADTFY